MSYELVIVADTNDADYIHRISEINDDDLLFILKIVSVIKQKTLDQGEKYFHNWPTQERGDSSKVYEGYLSEAEILRFEEDYLPLDEFGIHTIESIEYYPKPEKVKLL